MDNPLATNLRPRAGADRTKAHVDLLADERTPRLRYERIDRHDDDWLWSGVDGGPPGDRWHAHVKALSEIIRILETVPCTTS